MRARECVTSALFLGDMLRARKYRFALCFRVLRYQYVERSAYANVFKFNREKKRFERAEVNSRYFHWFPAAMLESFRLAPTWRLHTIIFSDTLCRVTRVRNIAHPRNFGTLFIYYSFTIFWISWLNLWNGKRFYFSFTCMIIELTCVTWKPPIGTSALTIAIRVNYALTIVIRWTENTDWV